MTDGCLYLRLLPFFAAIELGSGCGTAGLALSSFGARVLCTDLASVLPHLAANIAANVTRIQPVGGEALSAPYAWGTPLGPLETSPDGVPWEVIILSDVAYHRDLFEPLVRSLLALTEQRGSVIYQSHLHRFKAERHYWHAVKRHFAVENLLPCSE